MAADKHLFCFGLGYSGLYFAEQLQAQGWRVSGTTTGSAKKESLRQAGIEAHLFDEETPLSGDNILSSVTHLLISISPGKTGDVVLNSCLDLILSAHNLQWVGYLSTTGIYGDHEGAWVDEHTPPAPNNERGRRRVEAEEVWMSLHKQHGLPVHIFRLSGIYGPDRSVMEEILEGTARRIFKPGQHFSRIHVEDIAETLMTSISRSAPGEIYNVCDDEPAPSHEVVEYACALLKADVPPLVPFEKAELSEMGRSFYMSNRRVSNRKLREILKVKLRYPTYREGIGAIADSLQQRS